MRTTTHSISFLVVISWKALLGGLLLLEDEIVESGFEMVEVVDIGV